MGPRRPGTRAAGRIPTNAARPMAVLAWLIPLVESSHAPDESLDMGRQIVAPVRPMNYSDLFVVVLLVAGMYGLIVALARQPQFLTKAVNPYRGPWLLAALTALWFGIGLLRLEPP